MLLVYGFLGDATSRLQLQHVVDEVRPVLHHERGTRHRAALHGRLRLVLVDLQVHVRLVVVGPCHGDCLIVLELWRGLYRLRSQAALHRNVIVAILLNRVNVHTGLEIEFLRYLVRQPFTAIDV